MPQVLVRRHAIAHQLLQFLGFRKPALFLSRPDQFAVDAHLEDTARAGNQRHLAEVGVERREQFLRQPPGAQYPATLGAVSDFHARMVFHGLPLLWVIGSRNGRHITRAAFPATLASRGNAAKGG
jgi:hypothetical protein